MVQDQMQIESGGRLRIDLLEEPEKLLVSMARHAVADGCPIEQAQRREEGGRARAPAGSDTSSPHPPLSPGSANPH